MKCDDCKFADEHEMFTKCKLDGIIQYRVKECIEYAPKGGKKINCCVCSKEIKDEDSHNAEPYKDGRCCTECNKNIIIPARLRRW